MRYSFCILFIYLLIQKSFAQQWNDVGGGSNHVIQCMYIDTSNNLLYVGGQFDSVGTISAHKIAIWDGVNWSSVGTNNDLYGNAEAIQAITIFNNEIIIGGLFDSVGNVAAKNVARWNGTQWNPLGNGFDGSVITLQSFRGELYAGGGFVYSGSDTMNYISKWDGQNWIRVNSGFNNTVSSLLSYKDTLIIGGAFTSNSESTLPGSSVYGYDGNNWVILGDGLPPAISKTKLINDTLYCVGSFSNNFTGFHYITKWDGQNWLPHAYPGGGTQPWITDLAYFFNQIVVCGFFTTPPDVAVFNGSSYDSLANVSGYVNHLEVYKNELYVTGSFSSLNNLTIRNIAKYTFLDDISDIKFKEINSFAYPNPVKRDENLNLILPEYVKYPIQIYFYNSTGSLVYSQTIQTKYSQIVISKNNPGIYILNCLDNNGRNFNTKVFIY